MAKEELVKQLKTILEKDVFYALIITYLLYCLAQIGVITLYLFPETFYVSSMPAWSYYAWTQSILVFSIFVAIFFGLKFFEKSLSDAYAFLLLPFFVLNVIFYVSPY